VQTKPFLCRDVLSSLVFALHGEEMGFGGAGGSFVLKT